MIAITINNQLVVILVDMLVVGRGSIGIFKWEIDNPNIKR